jgi:hypothetical protein
VTAECHGKIVRPSLKTLSAMILNLGLHGDGTRLPSGNHNNGQSKLLDVGLYGMWKSMEILNRNGHFHREHD